MIEPNIYCKVCGITMHCVAEHNREKDTLPTVIEIGCADGQGTCRFAGFTNMTICVDPMVGGRPDIVSLEKDDWITEDKSTMELFKRRVQDFPVTLVKGCSLWKETLAEVGRILGNQKADILVIDGCHHPFEAVWGDFEAYYPFVRKGGFVVFDDLYEECIEQAFDKARSDHKMELVERWGVRRPDILQECAALRKTED